MLEQTRRKHGLPVLLSLVIALGAGCADDNAVTTEGPVGTSTGTDTSPITFAMDTTESSTTAVVDDTASGGTSSTGSTGPTVDDTATTADDTTSTTGDENIPGQTMNQLVTAGERSSSPSYTLVYTFGQPSSLQSTHQSTSYTIHGGLIGANGSRP